MKLARLHDGPEIFLTLQGEGPSAGSPAVFVRAAMCNLRCGWCDSSHAWKFGKPGAFSGSGAQDDDSTGVPGTDFIEISPAGVVRRILAFDCDRIVLTGGEPMLQQPAWVEVLGHLRKRRPGLVAEVETNGTRLAEPAFEELVDQFNVSPKLSNSGMPERARLVPEALHQFASSSKSWFKFVVSRPEDIEEILPLIDRFALPPTRTILMPEGRSAEALDQRAAWLVPACLKHNFRFGDRLQIRLWGDQPGT